jgi:ABC-2 type transport system ATP-binding protein
VKVLGTEPVRDSARLRHLIGYMPQKFGLYEDLTVLENLNLHADLRGVIGKERECAFERVLKFTELRPFTGRLAGRLSGGMKQKLGLACALLGNPRLLLLDEPSVGVDPISRRELWRIVQSLVADGLSVLWSTACLDEAELCPEVLLLDSGKLLFSGAPGDLVRDVRAYRIRNIGSDRRAALASALALPEVQDAVIQGDTIRFVLRHGKQMPAVEAFMGTRSAQITPAPPRLEDAYINAVGGVPSQASEVARQMQPISPTHDAVVEATGLTRRFGDFVAVNHVSFGVRRGEIFGLLGPNGAGKSTTFRMMCGLLPPTSGTARVMGIDLAHSPSRARQHIGYMAQKFSLYGNLTLRQNLRFFSGAYGLTGAVRNAAIESMMQVFDLKPFAEMSAELLPLGCKQRLALACALMHQPAILFLDEPTSGVDPVSRRQFWSHINGLVGKGVTVVVTTHFMDEAEYCDRIALVHRGRVIASGSPDELKARAAAPEVPKPDMEETFIRLVQAEHLTPA